MIMPCTKEHIVTHLRLNGPGFGKDIVHKSQVMLREMVNEGVLVLLPDIRLAVNEKRN